MFAAHDASFENVRTFATHFELASIIMMQTPSIRVFATHDATFDKARAFAFEKGCYYETALWPLVKRLLREHILGYRILYWRNLCLI